MGNFGWRRAAALTIAGSVAGLNGPSVLAQDGETVLLPGIEVIGTRLVPGPRRGPVRGVVPADGAGTASEPGPEVATAGTGTITGTSTTVITAADIARSPGQTVQDVLAREPGIQVRSLFGGVNGAQTTVDMRGFGATAASNTLVLVNGRRLNDVDLAGIDFSAIPLNSIERIEISRGNSGGVLYGDGAVGGVINIVTKSGVDQRPSARLQGSVGSYGYREGNLSFSGSSGPFATALAANAISSEGYRVNNKFNQKNAVGDFRWTDRQGTTAYFNLSGDIQELGLPGGRLVTPTSNELVTDRRGAATPFDFAEKQGANATLGVTRVLMPGTELVVDGGVRHKHQQAGFFSAFGPDFDSGFKATLTTFSLTPRLSSQHSFGAMPGKLLAGVDIYDATYGSDRSLHLDDPPIHRYDLTQRTVAGYFQETIGMWPTTDVAFGARVQSNHTTARDRLDLTAPGAGCLFCSPAPQATPLDKREMQYALHIGLEHRFNDAFAVFARAARSFRLPTVDERIAIAPFGVPSNFDLKTQTSHDIEGGIRVKVGTVSVQSSVYDMQLQDEIFFSPATFTNTNLDPTHRYGVENMATWQASETLQFKAGVAYTRSVFREGPFAGKDVPLVSRWSGNAAVAWNIHQKFLVFDAVARLYGSRRMENDPANLQTVIPGQAIMDLRIGGEYQNLFWSLSAQNLFDTKYFEYAVASAFTIGRYNAYPLPGRTFLAKAGVTW